MLHLYGAGEQIQKLAHVTQTFCTLRHMPTPRSIAISDQAGFGCYRIMNSQLTTSVFPRTLENCKLIEMHQTRLCLGPSPYPTLQRRHHRHTLCTGPTFSGEISWPISSLERDGHFLPWEFMKPRPSPGQTPFTISLFHATRHHG